MLRTFSTVSNVVEAKSLMFFFCFLLGPQGQQDERQFFTPWSDIIHWSRLNFARKSTPWFTPVSTCQIQPWLAERKGGFRSP